MQRVTRIKSITDDTRKSDSSNHSGLDNHDHHSNSKIGLVMEEMQIKWFETGCDEFPEQGLVVFIYDRGWYFLPSLAVYVKGKWYWYHEDIGIENLNEYFICEKYSIEQWAYIDTPDHTQVRIPLKKNAKRDCKTYLMKNKRNGLYKIGRSINPYIRERTLQSEEPEIEMVITGEADIEKELHERYDKERVRGEWFELNKIQVINICNQIRNI